MRIKYLSLSVLSFRISQKQSKGKNKTQRIVIHYRFIGVIENPVKEENIVLEARQGVAVEYLTA